MTDDKPTFGQLLQVHGLNPGETRAVMLRNRIARAVKGPDPRSAEVTATCCRTIGMSYAQTLALVQSLFPEVTMAEWDELVREGEADSELVTT